MNFPSIIGATHSRQSGESKNHSTKQGDAVFYGLSGIMSGVRARPGLRALRNPTRYVV
jgi:hypothetical protein